MEAVLGDLAFHMLLVNLNDILRSGNRPNKVQLRVMSLPQQKLIRQRDQLNLQRGVLVRCLQDPRHWELIMPESLWQCTMHDHGEHFSDKSTMPRLRYLLFQRDANSPGTPS